MSNVFSSEFWRSLYFRATGGQATEAAAPTGEISARLSGSASFVATISSVARPATDLADTHDGVKRRELIDQDTLRALARAEEEAEQGRRAKEQKSKLDLRRIIGRVLGEPEPEPEAPTPSPVPVPAPAVTLTETAQDEAALAEAARLKAQRDEDDAIILLLLAA